MKSCPFCGANIINTDGLIKHKPDCYIMVHFYSTPKREQDLRAWERRPIEDSLNELIAFEREQKIKAYLALAEIFNFSVWDSPNSSFIEDIRYLQDIASKALAIMINDNLSNE